MIKAFPKNFNLPTINKINHLNKIVNLIIVKSKKIKILKSKIKIIAKVHKTPNSQKLLVIITIKIKLLVFQKIKILLIQYLTTFWSRRFTLIYYLVTILMI
jgi:hypothetical protein